MLSDNGEDGISLTELLCKELEPDVFNSQSHSNGERCRDAATPPRTMPWQAALLKPSSNAPLEGQSFMELLDGEVEREVSTSRASTWNDSPGCRSISSIPPPPRTLPNTALPPPRVMKPPMHNNISPLMKVPPPVGNNVPPSTAMNVPPPVGNNVPPFTAMKVPLPVGNNIPPSTAMNVPPPVGNVPPATAMNVPPPVGNVPPATAMNVPPPVGNVPSATAMNVPPPVGNNVPPFTTLKVPPPVSNNVPSPAMMKIPPPVSNNIPPVSNNITPPISSNITPVSINVPPPSFQFSGPLFPPISCPPPAVCPMMPVNCPVPPPPVPPFMNGGFRPVPSGDCFSQMPYYGYGNISETASFSELPISVAEIPDTTLATQLKLKKKKKAKKEPKNPTNGIIFTDSPAKSPISNSTATVPEIAISVASILPPPPRPPKMVAPLPASSPAEVKTPYLKHVKEHKLIVKVDKRTLKEKAPPVTVPEKKRAIVAEYDSESDDERYDVESYRKRALHRSITSVRLDENEALPDLYSKLKKLNEELAMLQRNETSKSSESELSDSFCKEGSPEFKKMKTCGTKPDEIQKKAKDNDGSTGRISPLVISENHNTCRPKLDVRIKMMMGDKMTSPIKVQQSSSKRQSVPPAPPPPPLPPPPPVAPAEELHDPKGRTVAFDSLPPPPAASVATAANLFLPLDRAPSPFLSEEIHQYWQKESIKFRKFLKKSPKFIHLDPYGRYKFRKNRFAPVTKNTLKSSEALNIYSILDRKLAKNTESLEKKASEEHEKAVVSAEIDEDLKRLEAITKELQMLEEEEKRMHMEGVIDGKEENEENDDERAENHCENNHNVIDEIETGCPLVEVSDDLKRLEEIQRQLRELEAEEATLPENDAMECDRVENNVEAGANEENDRRDKKNSDSKNSAVKFDITRLQETLSAELKKSDDKSNDNSESLTKSSLPDNVLQVKRYHNELSGVKRSSEGDIISLVMNSVMEELRKDLKSSIASNLLKNQHAEVDQFSRKKRKTAV